VCLSRVQGESEAALEVLGRVLLEEVPAQEGQPLLLRALLGQASISKQLGRMEEAVELIRKASELDPEVGRRYLEPLERELSARHQ
jgi:tetratricopeptide (TPR) repeat protein